MLTRVFQNFISLKLGREVKLVVEGVMSTKSISSLPYAWRLSMEWHYKLILSYLHVNLTPLSFFEVSSLRFILNHQLHSFIHPMTTVHPQLVHGYATDDWVLNMIWGMSNTLWLKTIMLWPKTMSPRSITMWPCPTITMPWLEIMWKNGFCFSLFLNWFLSMLRSLHVPNSSMVLGHVCDKDNKIWWMSRTMWLKITWPWPTTTMPWTPTMMHAMHGINCAHYEEIWIFDGQRPQSFHVVDYVCNIDKYHGQ